MEGGCTDVDVADAAGEAGCQVGCHGGKNGGNDGEKPSQREIADLLLPDRPQ